jgi:hypothetical protein
MTAPSYVDADASKPLYDTTVASILVAATEASPDREALIEGITSDRRSWTYAQLFEAAS